VDEAQCAKCGTPVMSDAKFCENCGQPVDAAPTITQESYEAPQAPTPSQMRARAASRRDAAFWLGLIGVFFGLFLGIWPLIFSLNNYGSLEGLLPFIGIIASSFIGLFGTRRIQVKRDTWSFGLMFLGGVGLLFLGLFFGGVGLLIANPFGIYTGGTLMFSALLLIIGGVLTYLKKESG
jgi:hypothetical protein